ncbi:uncharacterized protein BCR38DRAFT_490700 [Pseudomassariella vexata]|uniref:Uncharacterized protein n=1 Tax=Pseudomassariella vexata TaxID=1141098 RepID=A0A1Y2DAV1_9PEZI|nr:uncharacterized protein BCR38DRAFT_490700 [Pseudomassariella vexata]ORY56403.1 hypothetical protein BCR38DRAFT_490700 [Pseudomassariella vexata]
MHFLKSLTTLFAGAALMGVASAAAVNTKISARDSPFSDLGLDSDFWGTMDNYCRGTASSKRVVSSLQARATAPNGYDVVSPGKYQGSFQVITNGGAWTDFLVTCYGVVIVGDTTNAVAKNKFLAHFYAVDSFMDDLWSELSGEVGKQDLTNMKAWVSLPDISTAPPDLNRDNMQTVENKMKDLLKGLTGQAPTARYHSMSDASDRVGDIGTMQLNYADSTVKIDGQDVAFGS